MKVSIKQGIQVAIIEFCDKNYYSTEKRQHFSHTESFLSSDTRQSMKRRVATERLSKIYIARCGYTWLDESKWLQEWPISPTIIIYLKIPGHWIKIILYPMPSKQRLSLGHTLSNDLMLFRNRYIKSSVL